MKIDDPTALLGNSSRFRVTQELCIKSWCGLICKRENGQLKKEQEEQERKLWEFKKNVLGMSE